MARRFKQLQENLVTARSLVSGCQDDDPQALSVRLKQDAETVQLAEKQMQKMHSDLLKKEAECARLRELAACMDRIWSNYARYLRLRKEAWEKVARTAQKERVVSSSSSSSTSSSPRRIADLRQGRADVSPQSPTHSPRVDDLKESKDGKSPRESSPRVFGAAKASDEKLALIQQQQHPVLSPRDDKKK